jgi:hypothetical protein
VRRRGVSATTRPNALNGRNEVSKLHHAQPGHKHLGAGPDADREPDGWLLLVFVILLIVFASIA